MDDLEGQIRQVLGDPEQMAQIMGLAQSLMGGGEAEGRAQPAQETEAGLVGKLGALLKQNGGRDDRQALMQAMRPYLSEKRQRKMDRAMQITRMAHLAKLAMAGLGETEDA